ncbi:hypothetical protein H1R20_g5791, partial [Candolleomyces eurysporus]
MSEAPPASPSRRRTSPETHHAGIKPSDIIGKVVKRVRKSSTHPAFTIDFADDTAVQIRVEGYDPQHPGLPKTLETDAYLQELMSSDKAFDCAILGCSYVTLSDKAFERRRRDGEDILQHWDQQHVGLALKFADGQSAKARWHCIWAAKQEHDQEDGGCIFRSYEDVYLDYLCRTRCPPESDEAQKAKIPSIFEPQWVNVVTMPNFELNASI